MKALQTDEQITPITTPKRHRAAAGRARHHPRTFEDNGDRSPLITKDLHTQPPTNTFCPITPALKSRITQHKLTVAIGVPPRRINEIVHGKRGITADTAMRLSRYFGTTAGFWMNLQMRYELDRAEDTMGDTLSGIVPLATVEVA